MVHNRREDPSNAMDPRRAYSFSLHHHSMCSTQIGLDFESCRTLPGHREVYSELDSLRRFLELRDLVLATATHLEAPA